MCLPSPKPKSNIFWFFLNLSFNLGNLPLNILITPSAGYEISFTLLNSFVQFFLVHIYYYFESYN